MWQQKQETRSTDKKSVQKRKWNIGKEKKTRRQGKSSSNNKQQLGGVSIAHGSHCVRFYAPLITFLFSRLFCSFYAQ